ncbi:hypothetical protein JTB14_009817 [Gonioctena quinquepunctata]|nr:hypothetical protein JTB14_009817 [Gonioctena quinquepunctata]
MLKEIKAKENLDNYLKTLKAKIDPEKYLRSTEKISKKYAKRPNGIYYERGAIPKKLVPTQEKNLVDKSLEAATAKEEEDRSLLPLGELVSFPRLIEKGIQLYRYHPCFLQDVKVVYDVEDEIRRQKSFLTYSLTSLVSSLRFAVNEQDLSDW